MEKMSLSTGTAPKKGLGEMLVEAGWISAEQLEESSAIQLKQNRKLGEILIERGLVSPERIASILSLQMNMPLIDLKLHTIRPEALKTESPLP